MHYTFHLTNQCNMACRYCYVDHENPQTMNMSMIETAVEYIVSKAIPGSSIGIAFFGGEPLMCKEQIYRTVELCQQSMAEKQLHFHYKLTTNGLLLDNSFMKFSEENNLFIAISHDGMKTAHDLNRIDLKSMGTYDRLEPIITTLLRRRPYTPVMITVTPETVSTYAASVEALFDKGFRYLICSMNYEANWDTRSLTLLKAQYKKLSDLYYRWTIAEEKFYLSPFEVKISSHINRSTYCHERCELGLKQVSIGPDGKIYPCVQFVYDEAYVIGDLWKGLDQERQMALYRINEDEHVVCAECDVRERCNHYCGCLNKQVTGSITDVAPSLCAHERILLPIADRLAEKLIKARHGLFIQKQYNELFPLISYIESIEAAEERQ